MSVVTIDGKPATEMISCHYNHTFTYFLNGKWQTARTVPRSVLNDPELPDGERRRVLMRMALVGVAPS